nr:hypothetical protein [Lysinibacillus xylanilyticus]
MVEALITEIAFEVLREVGLFVIIPIFC